MEGGGDGDGVKPGEKAVSPTSVNVTPLDIFTVEVVVELMVRRRAEPLTAVLDCVSIFVSVTTLTSRDNF